MSMREIERLGFIPFFLESLSKEELGDFEIGRVVSEQKDSYFVETKSARLHSQITGNLRFAAQSRLDLPATGDWVLLTLLDSNSAIIHKVLPRKSILQRKSVGSESEIQILSTNVDFAIIVQALDENYNLNRLERYLVVSNVENVTPIILLNKVDLISKEQQKQIELELTSRIKNINYIFYSNLTNQGKEEINKFLEFGKTFCVIGSSGVGKSTFINSLIGKNLLQTSSISSSNSKGKHTTTSRELIVTEKHGIFIDTPGMRELGITNQDGSFNETFEEIEVLASECKFRDCSHTNEVGCAILKAIEDNEGLRKSFENYTKIKREQLRFSLSINEKREMDKKRVKLHKSIQEKNRKSKQS